MLFNILRDMYFLLMFNSGHSEIVAGNITHSLQHSDMVKTSFDLLPYLQVGILNDG